MFALQNYGSSSETDSDTETSEQSDNAKDDAASANANISDETPAHLQPIVDSAMSVAKSLAIVAAPDVVPSVSCPADHFSPSPSLHT